MGPKPGYICKGAKNHLFAPILIINAKKMHCYHMALSHFKILTIFGNLQRAVNPSLKWLKRLGCCIFFVVSARLYLFFLQSKQHLSKKKNVVISCRSTTKRLQDNQKCSCRLPLSQKVDLLQLYYFFFLLKTRKEIRERRSDLERETQCRVDEETPSVTSVGL